MPRPRKCRRICALPENRVYGPINHEKLNDKVIIMSVDEFETIRLIDYEGLSQEDCAKQMDVARTTVQRIYNNAREKIANSLVEGAVIRIEGGDYKLCDEKQRHHRCCRCRKHTPRTIKENSTNQNDGHKID